MPYIYGKAITYGVVSLLILGGFTNITFKMTKIIKNCLFNSFKNLEVGILRGKSFKKMNYIYLKIDQINRPY